MPKETFFRLSDEKREEMKKKVYALFVHAPYEEIGIRDITKHLNISLGNFYNYFEDKDELYLYYFYEIEERLIRTQRENHPFFTPYEYVPFADLLTEEERMFGDVWYHVPRRVLIKFYFDGYAERLNKHVYEELVMLQQEGKLKENINIDFTFHMILSCFFNFLNYVRSQNLTDEEYILKLKKHYLEDMVFPGILTDAYHSEIFGK